MKHSIIFLLFFFVIVATNHAQKFITSGTVEYEVKTNIKKGLEGEDDMWSRALIDKIPAFTVNYYSYSFTDNKGLYKFDRTGDKQKSAVGLPEWKRITSGTMITRRINIPTSLLSTTITSLKATRKK